MYDLVVDFEEVYTHLNGCFPAFCTGLLLQCTSICRVCGHIWVSPKLVKLLLTNPKQYDPIWKIMC